MFDSRPSLVLCLVLCLSVTARHTPQEGNDEQKDTNKHHSRLSRQITPFYNFGYDQPPQEKYDQKSNQDVQRETLNLLKDISANLNQQSRPPQYNYPFYPQPPPQPYYPYGPQGHDQILQSKILRLLDDISLQLKQQQVPQPPQIIYVPYPFPQPKCECTNENGTGNISFDKRFKPEDPRQIWGKTEPIVADDGIQSAFRPVSFDVIPSSRPFTRSTSNQQGNKQAKEN